MSATLLRCGHEFCDACLVKWLVHTSRQAQQARCPLCRQQVQLRDRFFCHRCRRSLSAGTGDGGAEGAEAVSLSCGHRFCARCLLQDWMGAEPPALVRAPLHAAQRRCPACHIGTVVL